MNQGKTARNAKVQFLKMFLDSIYRGYRGHLPDIAMAKFPISRYRDDRDLSVCLALGQPLVPTPSTEYMQVLLRGQHRAKVEVDRLLQ